MKRLMAIAVLLAGAFSAPAALNSYTLTVTNTAITSNSITAGGRTRVFTNATTSTTVLTNLGGPLHTTTNLINAFGSYLQTEFSVTWLTATQLTFRGPDLAVSVSGGGQADWAYVTTNLGGSTNLTAIMGPPSFPFNTNRTNFGNWIIEYASDYTLGKFVKTNAAAFSNLVSIGIAQGGGTQRVYGPKTFDSFQGTNGGFIYNGGVSNMNVSRLNFRPFGAATSATNFGAMIFYDRLTNQVATIRANSNGIPSMYDSASADAWHNDELLVALTVDNAAALLNVLSAAQSFPLLAPTALNGYLPNTWTSTNVWSSADNRFALLLTLTAGFNGTAGTWTNGTLWNATTFGLLSTNSTFTGTNRWDGDIAFQTRAVTSLANGNNAGIVLGTNVNIRLSGASGAHTNCGFAATRDGDWKILRFANPGGTCVIANQSGVEPTAANRIVTGTGGELVMTNQPAYLEIIYNGTDSRWEVVRFSR